MKKHILVMLAFILAAAMLSAGAPSANPHPMPAILANARFVYITSYDGGQFNPDLLPADRAAIARVENAIEKWGKLTVVYRPQEADVILAVQSRSSEDVLAVYDAHPDGAGSRPSQTYLWRVMGRGGLQQGEMPLLSQFEKAWDKIAK